jgi:hypothetical protein
MNEPGLRTRETRTTACQNGKGAAANSAKAGMTKELFDQTEKRVYDTGYPG